MRPSYRKICFGRASAGSTGGQSSSGQVPVLLRRASFVRCFLSPPAAMPFGERLQCQIRPLGRARTPQCGRRATQLLFKVSVLCGGGTLDVPIWFRLPPRAGKSGGWLGKPWTVGVGSLSISAWRLQAQIWKSAINPWTICPAVLTLNDPVPISSSSVKTALEGPISSAI